MSIILHNPNIPIIINKDILKINYKKYLLGNINFDNLSILIDKFINNNLNSQLTNLVTNNLIPDKDFYPLIISIYIDINNELQKISPLKYYSKLLLKGGNIYQFIYNDFINTLKDFYSQKNIGEFKKNTGTYFKKSDIDLQLLVNYKQALGDKPKSNQPEYEDWVNAFNKLYYDIHQFKILCKDVVFKKYKTFIPSHIIQSIDKDRYQLIIDNINTEIESIIDLFININQELDNPNNQLVKNIILYLRSKKILELDLILPNYGFPDITIIPLNKKIMNKDIILSYSDNSEHFTNLYWQDNKRVSFFINTNLNLSQTTHQVQSVLSKAYVDFTLLRLMAKFKKQTHKNEILYENQAEIIDLSINLIDDYYGTKIHSSTKNFDNSISEYYFNDIPFLSYSHEYLVKELLNILFGIEGDNIQLTSAYKFSKRLDRLFVLIIIDLCKNNKLTDVILVLEYIKNKLIYDPPLNRVYENIQDHFSHIKIPLLSRNKSSLFKGKDNKIIHYLQSDNKIIDSILGLNSIPENKSLFYLFFEKIFRIFSRLYDYILDESKYDIEEQQQTIINRYNIIADYFIDFLNSSYEL